jgi:hypothetical protein
MYGCNITMRCSPADVNNASLMMSDRLKQRITNLGFGSLLKKNIEGLEDKHLGAFWLSI